MSKAVTIALDAMGGDAGPAVVVAGADLARLRHPDLRFILFGDGNKVERLLKRRKALASLVEIHHTDETIAGDARPSQALRKGRQSSMWLAIEAVKEGQADAVVSAGNTGALMAMSKSLLRTLPGIDRPAIVSFFPTMRGESCMLDLGANVDCDANNLVEFALMGAAFARSVLGLKRPLVGLLNIGVEEVKGNDTVRSAGQVLRQADLPLEFFGFVEGDDIAAGTVDVIVTDGFTGNIALKTAEGAAKLFTIYLRRTLTQSIVSRLGYLLARPALKVLRERIDPRLYNGAMFLGLNGITVKSHGGTDATGFASAVEVAADMAIDNICGKITADLERFSKARGDTAQVVAG